MTRFFPYVWSSLAAIALTNAPSVAWAHGAHIQARTATAIEIQATYDSGEPLAEATVQVYAPDDLQEPVFTGVTDTEGRYTFTPSQPGDWEVTVRQAGHGDVAVIPVTDEGALVSSFTNQAGLSWPQTLIVAGAVTWGCVGTALYFGGRSKQ